MEDNEILTLLWERKEVALSELEQKYGSRLKTLASYIADIIFIYHIYCFAILEDF